MGGTPDEKFVGELIFRSIIYVCWSACPWSKLISEICKVLYLEHGPALYIWLSGELIFCKARNEITSVSAGRINQALIFSRIFWGKKQPWKLILFSEAKFFLWGYKKE